MEINDVHHDVTREREACQYDINEGRKGVQINKTMVLEVSGKVQCSTLEPNGQGVTAISHVSDSLETCQSITNSVDQHLGSFPITEHLGLAQFYNLDYNPYPPIVTNSLALNGITHSDVHQQGLGIQHAMEVAFVALHSDNTNCNLHNGLEEYLESNTHHAGKGTIQNKNMAKEKQQLLERPNMTLVKST